VTAIATTVRPASRPGGHTLAVGSQDNKIRLRDVTGGAVQMWAPALMELVAGLGQDLRPALRGRRRRAGALDLVPRSHGCAVPAGGLAEFGELPQRGTDGAGCGRS
jgi:hypothetical protein